jgi:hypothetical protein
MKGVEDVRQRLLNSGLKEKNKDVKACAVWTLGWIGQEEDIPVLQKLRKTERDKSLTLLIEGAIMKIRGKDHRLFSNAEYSLGKDMIPRYGGWPVMQENKGKGNTIQPGK